MTELDWTPIPGNKLNDDEAQELIARFRSIYRVHTEGRPVDIPTWVTFPPGKTVVESILSEPPITDYKALYFHIENGQEVYLVAPSEIAQYFAQRNPWETNWDYYVFSPSLKWAIAFTHELMYGPITILVGDLSSEVME
jgi:hypothetical protein